MMTFPELKAYCEKHFDITEGKITWKDTPLRSKVKIGTSVGAVDHRGYTILTIKKKIYYAHRLLYMIYNDIEIGVDIKIVFKDDNKQNFSKDNLVIKTKDAIKLELSGEFIKEYNMTNEEIDIIKELDRLDNIKPSEESIQKRRYNNYVKGLGKYKDVFKNPDN